MEILRQAARLVGFKNRQYETLTEINFQGEGGAKIRIWRSAKSIKAAQAFDHAAMQAQMREIVETLSSESWIAELMKLPNVACVAIVDGQGNGVSGYPDWG